MNNQTITLEQAIEEELSVIYSTVRNTDFDLGFRTGAIALHDWQKEQEGYFFTPEQLNQYTQDVIKQALETAAKDAFVEYEFKTLANNNGVNTNSITNTFDETFKKFKV